MKFSSLLGLSLIALVSAPLVARADVCDKSSESKVHVVLMPDGRIGFTEYTAETCNLVGPQSSYSWDELVNKRAEYRAIVDKSGIEDAGNVIKLLGVVATLSGSGLSGGLAAANSDGPTLRKDADNEAKVPHAKAVLDALALDKIRPSDKCIYVDDYAAYKATLVEQLGAIAAARPPLPVSSEKKSDLAGVKKVPAAGSPHKVGNAGPSQGGAQRKPTQTPVK